MFWDQESFSVTGVPRFGNCGFGLGRTTDTLACEKMLREGKTAFKSVAFKSTLNSNVCVRYKQSLSASDSAGRTHLHLNSFSRGPLGSTVPRSWTAWGGSPIPLFSLFCRSDVKKILSFLPASAYCFNLPYDASLIPIGLGTQETSKRVVYLIAPLAHAA